LLYLNGRFFANELSGADCDLEPFDFDTVDSTNNAAKRLIASGRISRTSVVTARKQTAGRGTRGRKWESPAGGIYLSVVLPDADAPLATTTAYTLAAGVGCVEALSNTAGVSVQLKPINDLILDGKKLGGILTEALIENGRPRAVIIGVGINFARVHLDLPSDGPQAISLQEALSPSQFSAHSRAELTTAIANAIHHRAEQVSRGQTNMILALWERFKIPGASTPIPDPVQPAAPAASMIE
jgi:BirA family biotin operon repressor/biotin-[acetyl-CoA-carboxylase] ligase